MLQNVLFPEKNAIYIIFYLFPIQITLISFINHALKFKYQLLSFEGSFKRNKTT